MINKIISILKNKGIEKYLIKHCINNSRELFFIKNDLSMARNVEGENCTLTVFKKFEKDGETKLGNSSVSIDTSMTDDDIAKLIDEANFSAGFVSNSFYNTPSNINEVDSEDSFNNMSLDECANIIATALYKNNTSDKAFINSAEIFADRSKIHLVSSDNIDVSYTSCLISGEYVCQAPNPVDVETYSSFSYKTLDTESLENMVKQSIENTINRSTASYKISSGTYDVMLSGECVYNFFSYFLTKAYAPNIVGKISNYKVGDNVQGQNIIGDMLNINLEPTAPFSGEGIKMIPRPFIEDGILKVIHGNSKDCSKINVDCIGSYAGMSVKCGENDDFPEPYLEALIFSDFQVDAATGFFGGELRLGLYHKGNECYPVTGCTISGNMNNVINNIKLSKSGQKFLGYDGPKSVLFKNVSITGNDI